MDGCEVKLMNAMDRLSLSSLSKSSPSTFPLKSYGYSSTTRIHPMSTPPPIPIMPTSYRSTAVPTSSRSINKKHSSSSSSCSSSSSATTTTNTNINTNTNLSHVPCKFFKQGTCTAGANCIFSHNSDPTSELSVCKYYRKGNCKFGAKCALLHTMSLFHTASKNLNGKNDATLLTTHPHPKHRPSHSTTATYKNSMLHSNLLLSHHHQRQPFEEEEDTSKDDFGQPPFSLYSPPSTFYQQQDDVASRNGMNDYHRLSPANTGIAASATSTALLHTIPEYTTEHPRYPSTNIRPYSVTESEGQEQAHCRHHHPVEEENNGYLDSADDFLLPSSLNDLLTPHELLNKKQPQPFFNSHSTSKKSHHKNMPYSLPSFTSTTDAWTVPFFHHHPSYHAQLGHPTHSTPQPSFHQEQLSPSSSTYLRQHAIKVPTPNNNHLPPFPSMSTHQQNNNNNNNNNSIAFNHPLQNKDHFYFSSEEEGPFFMDDTAAMSSIAVNNTLNDPFYKERMNKQQQQLPRHMSNSILITKARK